MINLFDSNLFDSLFVDADKNIYDLTSKEGHDKALEILNDAKNNSFISSLWGKDFIDSIIKKVNDKYEEANPSKQPDIVRPSTKCSEAQVNRVTELVNEYVDTVIEPISDFKPEVLKSIRTSLTEFGCWLLNK